MSFYPFFEWGAAEAVPLVFCTQGRAAICFFASEGEAADCLRNRAVSTWAKPALQGKAVSVFGTRMRNKNFFRDGGRRIGKNGCRLCRPQTERSECLCHPHLCPSVP